MSAVELPVSVLQYQRPRNSKTVVEGTSYIVSPSATPTTVDISTREFGHRNTAARTEYPTTAIIRLTAFQLVCGGRTSCEGHGKVQCYA